MTGAPKIKICGIKTPDAMTAALESGADFVGLVFYPPSPRFVEIEVASYLASYIPDHIIVTGLFVDPDDALLEETLSHVRLDAIQLHGAESPARVAEIKNRFKKPVIKALSVASKQDARNAGRYHGVADWLLLDAKGTTEMPGGGGLTFDWSLLEDLTAKTPWLLAGGLTPGNVAQAVHMTHPYGVDVSSGVESTRGVKDPAKIRAFIEAVKNL